MIKHVLKDDLVHVSIEKKDFSHRIPVGKLGKAIQWNIGAKGPEGIVVKNVSKWTLRLFTQQIMEDKYIKQFQSIVQEYSPKNNIDWKATLLAVNIQNEYNSRMAVQNAAENKMSEEEIIAIIEAKYNLD